MKNLKFNNTLLKNLKFNNKFIKNVKFKPVKLKQFEKLQIGVTLLTKVN